MGRMEAAVLRDSLPDAPFEMMSQKRFKDVQVQLERNETRETDDRGALYRSSAMFAAGKHELTRPMVSSIKL